MVGVFSGVKISKAYHTELDNYQSHNINTINPYHPIIKPNRLEAGKKVAILAPASPTNNYEIRTGVRYLQSKSLQIEVADTIKYQENRFRYLSAPDDVRIEELNYYLNREDIDAIIFGRGGYGLLRIIDKVDYNALIKNPKIIMGYSDITALLIALYQRSRIITYHGPVASSVFNNFTNSNLEKVIFSQNVYKIIADRAIPIVEGEARGELIGGNLSVICSMLGTNYEINTKGKIFFLEDVSENAYKIDRMLTQLRLAGKFDDANAVIFGEFKNLYTRRPFHPNTGYNIKEVIDQIVKPLNIPTIINFPFGHIKDKITLPIGVKSKIIINEKSLIFEENSVN